MPESNPILNNPYEEPAHHYATNAEGELDYECIRPGRRFFTGQVAAMPVTVGPQKEFASVSDDLSRAAKSKPPTLIIDSDALENSGQIDESFQKIFAPEIAQFRREYAVRHG